MSSLRTFYTNRVAFTQASVYPLNLIHKACEVSTLVRCTCRPMWWATCSCILSGIQLMIATSNPLTWKLTPLHRALTKVYVTSHSIETRATSWETARLCWPVLSLQTMHFRLKAPNFHHGSKFSMSHESGSALQAHKRMRFVHLALSFTEALFPPHYFALTPETFSAQCSDASLFSLSSLLLLYTMVVMLNHFVFIISLHLCSSSVCARGWLCPYICCEVWRHLQFHLCRRERL